MKNRQTSVKKPELIKTMAITMGGEPSKEPTFYLKPIKNNAK